MRRRTCPSSGNIWASWRIWSRLSIHNRRSDNSVSRFESLDSPACSRWRQFVVWGREKKESNILDKGNLPVTEVKCFLSVQIKWNSHEKLNKNKQTTASIMPSIPRRCPFQVSPDSCGDSLFHFVRSNGDGIGKRKKRLGTFLLRHHPLQLRSLRTTTCKKVSSNGSYRTNSLLFFHSRESVWRD